jgi:UDP-N-acetylmuramate dehydrogenase
MENRGTAIIDELKSACPGFRAQEPLSRHTSLAIGGPAEFYADVNTREELSALRQIVTAHQLPVFFIGAGSNLLISDRGIRGLVIHLQGEFRKWNFVGAQDVVTGAAVWMPALAKACAEKGLAGLEAVVGVPGTVGGGLVMNAGTREGWIGNIVVDVDAMNPDGSMITLGKEQLQFAYRRSNLENRWILGARLSLKPEPPEAILARMDAHLQYRARTQPLATSNCGSVFKNPPNQAAAQLIEQAGLKGSGIGDARISDRHANFIINEKNASAQDVFELMKRTRQRVHDKFGVWLEPEVKLIGEFPEKLS